MEYACVRKMLILSAKKSNISKRVNPHAFRYARATHLANKFTEARMKEYFGWTQASKMASIYVHLSGRDMDNAVLQLHGIKKEKEENNGEIKTKKCVRCNQVNSFESKYCSRCGYSLNEKDIMKIIEAERNILKMIKPEMIEQMIEEKIRERLSKIS